MLAPWSSSRASAGRASRRASAWGRRSPGATGRRPWSARSRAWPSAAAAACPGSPRAPRPAGPTGGAARPARPRPGPARSAQERAAGDGRVREWSHRGSALVLDQTRMPLMTFAPSTPVSFASRPWNLTVKASWSMPSRCSIVAWRSWTVHDVLDGGVAELVGGAVDEAALDARRRRARSDIALM